MASRKRTGKAGKVRSGRVGEVAVYCVDLSNYEHSRMSAMTETPTIEITNVLPTHFQTVDEFEAWERQPPSKGNYEFVRGHIIPKPVIKQDEVDIADFLIRQFMQTPQFAQKHTLIPEVDAYVDLARRRRPDLLYLTSEQRQAIRRGERVPAYFAIELLSDSETYDDVLE